jgi:hypothetical protein
MARAAVSRVRHPRHLSRPTMPTVPRPTVTVFALSRCNELSHDRAAGRCGTGPGASDGRRQLRRALGMD